MSTTTPLYIYHTHHVPLSGYTHQPHPLTTYHAISHTFGSNYAHMSQPLDLSPRPPASLGHITMIIHLCT